MKRNILGRFREWCRADFLSPKDFIRHAVLILAVYAVAHLAGLREFTSILNGTTGSLVVNREVAALLGVTYLLLYMGAVVLAPMLLIAAGLLAGWNKFKSRTSPST
ncbi:MAG: hypothetical protein HOP33_19860 [Verrucomicrobia bacterium]|nr:hypothetical protein [Verrucomicrobiota bacterium]